MDAQTIARAIQFLDKCKIKASEISDFLAVRQALSAEAQLQLVKQQAAARAGPQLVPAAETEVEGASDGKRKAPPEDSGPVADSKRAKTKPA